MPVTTISVGAAVTPTVIQTYFLHYLKRKNLHQKPTAHISYHEGLELIRRFLHYASFHTVDELQRFTSQWVPVPHWVHVREVDISPVQLKRSAQCITAQLGPKGIKAVGGATWWQWRREGTTLKAEWIEMRKDHDARKQLNITKGDRIMLYVHGGAYYFGSVDEHRYQMQRHARKLKARVLAPKYRLAPQFPFPCGLYDCLAAYFYLLDEGHDPSTIILAGDSAGGGMVLSILVTLRDQGIPLPAGAILISPWVDLTHSFPSLGGDDKMDYIPSHGFIHKPSMSWPPPNADDLLELERCNQVSQHEPVHSPRTSASKPDKQERAAQKEAKEERVRGYSIRSSDQPDLEELLDDSAAETRKDTWVSGDGKYSVGPKGMLSVQLDTNSRVEIKDQIQMYCANSLLTHPLVSPALQPTLGGLPPLLIQSGGGELLRDEQIYVAHKASQPSNYLPPPSNNQTKEEIQTQAAKYKPTNVQLQVWDDLCHVCPTLSFTRPAKHMYRSIAQFGAWSLARAQKKSIDILEDDDISFMSTDSSSSSGPDEVASSSSSEDVKSSKVEQMDGSGAAHPQEKGNLNTRVGRAGDPIPQFERHMIRQRIDRNGYIYPLPPKEELVALNLPVAEVGVPKVGPVSKWMKAQQQWNSKFSKQKIKIQKQRMKDFRKGFEGFPGETPPPTALAGRRLKGMKAEKAKKKSWGMMMWSGWGSQHDKDTIVREEKADSTVDQASHTPVQEGALERKDGLKPRRSRNGGLTAPRATRSRSNSRHHPVNDEGQTGDSAEDVSSYVPPLPGQPGSEAEIPAGQISPLSSQNDSLNDAPNHLPGIIISDNPQSPPTIIPATDRSSTRPFKGGIAYPFSLKVDGRPEQYFNASTVTLQSMEIATPPAVDIPQETKELGAAGSATESVNEQILRERPGVERFVTAGAFSVLAEDASPIAGLNERPHVERFETAREDLSTIAAGEERK
ncbi:hypothetical protein NX059_011161 [Plenodomus lindquistii]|nr:hypothetical protein NX059_011161 [Plenodomus lindquistii]